MGTLEIKNRLIHSSTDKGFATPEGIPIQELIDIDTELAREGACLIIAGTIHISLENKWGNNSIGMDSLSMNRA